MPASTRKMKQGQGEDASPYQTLDDLSKKGQGKNDEEQKSEERKAGDEDETATAGSPNSVDSTFKGGRGGLMSIAKSENDHEDDVAADTNARAHEFGTTSGEDSKSGTTGDKNWTETFERVPKI